MSEGHTPSSSVFDTYHSTADGEQGNLMAHFHISFIYISFIPVRFTCY